LAASALEAAAVAGVCIGGLEAAAAAAAQEAFRWERRFPVVGGQTRLGGHRMQQVLSSGGHIP